MTPSHPAEQAIRAFWKARTAAATRQTATGRTDTGRRGAVTAGKHLAELENIVAAEFIDAGVPPDAVRRRTGIELPGYYRPAKKWDIVVVDDGYLVAAIEFKSQVGPSFGNNFNNRVEEALGSAVDVWQAYEEGTFGANRPWLGYFFLLDSVPAATRPVDLPAPVFSIDPVFTNTSYQDRYNILCRQLIRERLYDAACFLTASDDPQSPIGEPDPEFSFAAFAAKIAGRVTEIRTMKMARWLPDPGGSACSPKIRWSGGRLFRPPTDHRGRRSVSLRQRRTVAG